MDTSDAVNTCAEERCREQLHCSLSSVDLESESDLSLAFEREEASPVGSCDELPAFEIRAFSPQGRTPSPIDDLNLSDIETPKQQLLSRTQELETRQNNPEYVALHEINAQISPPSDADDSGATLSRSNSLETIFEGVFLNTPPREKGTNGSPNSSSSRYTPKRSRSNLMELMAIGNRLHSGKENQSPGSGRVTSLQDPT
ncbi:uncharacterized protein [Drosophila kikkawai]|uniref:Uncharacterized protein n=1 Tax=Drosophila kikkawai TaxID=30033 RepID=A0A6P4J8Q3_DROKI|nr:uncharacterized protein LOC108080655 [Drosophila kikkawai]KAH8315592.1 hypothetical protein KR059_004175 [Drosophila kikkawai]